MPTDPGQQRIFVVFALVALATLGWLWHRRASLRRQWLDVTDRRLALCLGLLVLYPLTVLVHEYGHVVAVHLVGGEVLDIEWSLLEGAVTWRDRGPTSGTELWFVAVAGPAAQALAAGALGWVGWRARRTPVLLRLAAMAAAAAAGIQALLLYPLSPGGAGDFATIYGDQAPLAAKVATVGVHGWALLRMLRTGRAHLDEVVRRARA